MSEDNPEGFSKPGFGSRLKRKVKSSVANYSNTSKARRSQKKLLKEQGEAEAASEYQKGYIQGRKKAAYQKGLQAGQGGGGILGGLSKAFGSKPQSTRTTRWVGKGKNRHKVTTVRQEGGGGILGHIELGPKGNGEEFGIGGRDFGLISGDIGLGLGSQKRKGKKSDPYADLGL